jgi:prepilin-type N-terminal cleavage/methylation domain-containing protein
MSLENIKSKTQSQNGFTIVELLIVVVVIAILAAITIVSYNGITTRANGSAVKASAATVQKKAELFASDGPTSKYPAVFTDISTATADKSYYLGTTITNLGATAPTASAGTNAVQYYVCGVGSAGVATSLATVTNVSGGQIKYWDFVAGTVVATPISIGVTSGTVATYAVSCWAS